MSILSPILERRTEPGRCVLMNDLRWVVHLVAFWFGATGFIMIADSNILGSEQAWQAARFDGTIPLAAYGVVFLLAAIPVFGATRTEKLWTAGKRAGEVALILAVVLAVMLVAETINSGQGPLGALNFFVMAVFLYCLHRLTGGGHGRAAGRA